MRALTLLGILFLLGTAAACENWEVYDVWRYPGGGPYSSYQPLGPGSPDSFYLKLDRDTGNVEGTASRHAWTVGFTSRVDWEIPYLTRSLGYTVHTPEGCFADPYATLRYIGTPGESETYITEWAPNTPDGYQARLEYGGTEGPFFTPVSVQDMYHGYPIYTQLVTAALREYPPVTENYEYWYRKYHLFGPVTYHAPVPEPSGVVLLAGGLCTLALRRRR